MRYLTRLSSIASAALAAIAVGGPALADAGGGSGGGLGGGPGGYGGYGPGMMWGGDQWGGFGMVLGPIFMILVLVGIVVGVIYLIRTFAPHAVGHAPGVAEDRALAILRERLAKGEIEPKEFEERKRMLHS